MEMLNKVEHSAQGKFFSRRDSIIFPRKREWTEIDISYKLSPMETICMKCQILFSGNNKKNIINLPSAEFAQRVVKVKYLDFIFQVGIVLR